MFFSSSQTFPNNNTVFILRSRPPQIDYAALLSEVDRHTSSETDVFANGANVSSAVFHAIQSARGPGGCNWVGFYFCRSLLAPSPPEKQVLLLGPFQGKPACRRIAFEEGVCGKAATTRTAQLVPDVHKFPGHIA